jgi:hypothetical protein
MQKSEKSSDPNREYLFLGDTPAWKWLVKTILGENRPPESTRIAAIVQWSISLFLMSWHALRLFALTNRGLIEEKKGVRVDLLVRMKAFSLGYETEAFLTSLERLHTVGSVCWGFMLVGIALMYRRSNAYPFVVGAALMGYFFTHVVLFSWGYFFQEVGAIEQLLTLVSFLLFLFHFLWLHGREEGIHEV